MTKAEDDEDRKRTQHIDVPLGVRVRAIRENHGLTQADMARMLDISTNQWGRHESGANRTDNIQNDTSPHQQHNPSTAKRSSMFPVALNRAVHGIVKKRVVFVTHSEILLYYRVFLWTD